jgi:hypothetical protein
MEIDKSKFKDEKGRYIVQGLFLEDRYNTDFAVFTFDGEDKLYKGQTFYSLKRLYLEHGDPKEYSFARKYLYDWNHWQRLCKNAIIGRHIEDWRKELELDLISEGVSAIIDLATNQGSYQAAKYLADAGWTKEKVGRPSKEQIEGKVKALAEEEQKYNDDFDLIKLVEKKRS